MSFRRDLFDLPEDVPQQPMPAAGRAPAPGPEVAPPAATPPQPLPQPRLRAVGPLVDVPPERIAPVPAPGWDLAGPGIGNDGGNRDQQDGDQDDAMLAAALLAEGQHVPVVLRRHPVLEGRFALLHGRRRLRVLAAHGLPVRAIIATLPDAELARPALSFIERADCAARMAAAGIARKVICDALQLDKTLASRMLAVAEAVPPEVRRLIGAAPGIGRDRWLALAGRIPGRAHEAVILALGPSSDERFEAVFDGLSRPPRMPAPPAGPAPEGPIEGAYGVHLGRMRRGPAGITLALGPESGGFDEWLVENMAEIHLRFLRSRGL